MMTSAARRIYRLWRSSAILCLIGAVEVAVVAWQHQLWWVAIGCLPLVAISLYATRRAARMRGAS